MMGKDIKIEKFLFMENKKVDLENVFGYIFHSRKPEVLIRVNSIDPNEEDYFFENTVLQEPYKKFSYKGNVYLLEIIRNFQNASLEDLAKVLKTAEYKFFGLVKEKFEE